MRIARKSFQMSLRLSKPTMHNLPHHTRAKHAINTSIQVQWMLIIAMAFVGLWYIAFDQADKRFALEDRANQERTVAWK